MNSLIEDECRWLEQAAAFRGRNQAEAVVNVPELAAPALKNAGDPYGQFVLQNKLSFEERLLLIMTLMASIYPEFIYSLMQKANPVQKRISENESLGRLQGSAYPGTLPSAYFFLYLLNGNDTGSRFKTASSILKKEYALMKTDVIQLIQPVQAETPLTGYFRLDPSHLLLLVTPVTPIS